MAAAVIMPRQGQSVESCIITEWHKKLGDAVQEGEPLFSYETDKAAFEEQAKASGTLLAVFYREDDDVPCLSTVAVIGTQGEDISTFAPDTGAPSGTKAGAQTAQEQSAPQIAAAHVQKQAATQPVGISPRARGTAVRLGVDIALSAASGPSGRVIERDVRRLAQQRPASGLPASLEKAAEADGASGDMPQNAGEYEIVKMSGVRKVIARGMLESLQTSAQLTNHSAFDATELLRLRRQFKARHEASGQPNITINDMLLFACSRVLRDHPDLNAHFVGGEIRRFRPVRLGIAVDTPRGLLVPVVCNADTLSLPEIALKSKALITAAQGGAIDPDLLTGATFTVTNLGTLGVEHFTPVINPPQTGILGVGCIVERVRTVNGTIEAYPAMGLSLTYDHRVVDGAPAARFIQDLQAALENLVSIII